MRRFGAASVDVVGYSAGGVVARSWVRDHGGASVARRVLSVGSPQHGTVGRGAGARDRRPVPDGLPSSSSPTATCCAGSTRGDETPGGPRFVSVWSTADEIVVPPDSARLDGAPRLHRAVRLPGAATAHGDLPADPVVLAALRRTLGRGARPRPPTSTADAG